MNRGFAGSAVVEGLTMCALPVFWVQGGSTDLVQVGSTALVTIAQAYGDSVDAVRLLLDSGASMEAVPVSRFKTQTRQRRH